MSFYITIDSGTTNTRVNLVKNKEIIDTIKLEVGIKANMVNRGILKEHIKYAIEKILLSNNLTESGIIRILATGMITSEFGLCHLEHIETPAGINELSASIKEIVLADISSVPFIFIRGVKTKADSFETADVMRGEETELMGIGGKGYGECIYVFPGSHSKIIKTDASGRICDFTTMLTGEMIEVLSQGTILKDAVDLSVKSINSEYLLKGFDFCKEDGINKALFKTRILKNFFNCNKEELYSFFMGTVLCDEISEIIACNAPTVVIGGKAQIKNATALILSERDNKNIITLDDAAVSCSTALGAIKIFENAKRTP